MDYLIDLFKNNKVRLTALFLAAIVFYLGIKGCSREKNDSKEYILVTKNVYSGNMLKKDGVFLNVKQDEINNEMFEKISSHNEAVGLIVEPTNYTYASIYKTIDYVKKLIKSGNVSLPVFYNVDRFQTNPLTKRANVLLADMFVTKLTANGVYAGICGSPENIKSFRETFPEYTNSHVCDDFHTMAFSDNFLVSSSDLSDVDIIMYGSEGTSLIDYATEIRQGDYNNPNNFISDTVHIVKKGDVLSAIANKYGIKISDLIEYNNISDPNRINIGDEIIIPNAFSNKKGVEATNFEDYTVVSGDRLEDIAKKYNVTVSSICEYNSIIGDPDFIKAGWVLSIPVYDGTTPVVDTENNSVTVEGLSESHEEETISNQNISPIIRGIDISTYQRNIDWQEVSKHIDFAIIRMFSDADGRNRDLHLDASIVENLDGCQGSDIPVAGLYCYVSTVDPDKIIEDAEYISRAINENRIGLDGKDNPTIYIDIERDDFDRFRKSHSSSEIAEQLIRACEYIEESTHLSTGLYLNAGCYTDDFKDAILKHQQEKRANGEDFSIWITVPSTYNSKLSVEEVGQIERPVPNDEVYVYQYTQRGVISGYNDSIDIDLASSKIITKESNKIISFQKRIG